MDRPIAVVGAPSNIGLPPYDDGEARHVDWAPRVLRNRDLVKRIGAIDLGDVSAPPYRHFVRTSARLRNERQLMSFSRALGHRVALAIEHGRLSVVLGGDCSIVLGSLLGARQAVRGAVGLVYVDAHADFDTPGDSRTGSAAGMSLAFVTGRGKTPLSRLGNRSALVEDRHVALLGRRHPGEKRDDDSYLAWSAILDLPHREMLGLSTDDVIAGTLARVASPETSGFCVHVDVDVLDSRIMPAVGSPVPDGLSVDRLVRLLAPLIAHPKALSVSLAGYDPALDSDRSCARLLVNLMEDLFARDVRRPQLSVPAAGATPATAASTA